MKTAEQIRRRIDHCRKYRAEVLTRMENGLMNPDQFRELIAFANAQQVLLEWVLLDEEIALAA